MKLLATAGALGICALALTTTATAQPRRTAQPPLDLRTNTDYPLQGQPVTLTSYWVGLRPPYTPRYQLRYQVSRTNPPTWVDMPGYTCTAEPCQYSINSPAAAEFQSRPQGVVVLMRAVIRDTTTNVDTAAQLVKTVTWVPDPNRTVATPGGGYFLTLTVAGQPGCTAKPVHKVDTYANANCRIRGELDVHKAGIPVIPIGPDGRGRFTSAAFSIVATWGPLPPGQWFVRINHGNNSVTCYTSPCTLQIPNQTWDGNFVGRHNANASLGWTAGTRANPSTEGWPSGLGAEVGVDYMRR